MNLSQFEILNEDERYVIWLSFAVEIASYITSGLSHVLYQLDDFYIEIYLLQTFPQRIALRAFTDETSLNPYLERIDISEILLSS